ncbi:rhodanese-like domain-containing protein [Rhodoferax sp.]|uniref:rhodanese-like domain-containing protein n=1 Tax=Rhodoferax sp. TaxID=50421 RepID=UPI003423D05D
MIVQCRLPPATDKPVLLICNTQNRSSSTLAILLERGYLHVHHVQGGMSDWKRRGWPVVRF